MRVLGAFVVALSLSSVSAAAEPYISVFGGTGFGTVKSEASGMFFDPASLESNEFLLTDLHKTGAGVLFGGASGYEFNLPFPGRARIELEGSHKRAQKGEFFDLPDSITPPGGFFFAEGITDQTFEKTKSTAAMLNFVYVSPAIANLLSVYFGGGAGLSHIDFQFRSIQSVAIVDAVFIGAVEDVRLEFTAFQWQTMAGVSADITQSLDLFVEGRFHRSMDKIEVTGQVTGEQKRSFANTSVLAGIRFKFK